MTEKNKVCPDCETPEVNRRDFLRTVGATAAAATVGGVPLLNAAPTPKDKPETAVAKLYKTLTSEQKKQICFDWDYVENEGKTPRGLLRTHVSNNWSIVNPKLAINSSFFTDDQRDLIREIYTGLFSPEWVKKIDKQLKDDAGGYGKSQTIAIFGKPGEGKFEMVMTGRHITARADGNSTDHVAFGGPIFHGHAASGFNEKVHHPGNVFWPQALEANKVFKMLDGKQQKLALVRRRPSESAVRFRGPKGEFPGIPVTEMSADQKEQMQKVLQSLIAPYRKADKQEVLACLKKQGGLDKCSLAFYQDGDIGEDGEWDNWRLEGPSFVWYFRGHPHVHIWINVADSPAVELNARG